MRDTSQAVCAAIKSLGGPASVARLRSLKTPWSVSKWMRDGLPAEHVIWLAEQTGWKWKPHDLAPEFYPYPEDGIPPEVRAPSGAAA